MIKLQSKPYSSHITRKNENYIEQLLKTGEAYQATKRLHFTSTTRDEKENTEPRNLGSPPSMQNLKSAKALKTYSRKPTIREACQKIREDKDTCLKTLDTKAQAKLVSMAAKKNR